MSTDKQLKQPAIRDLLDLLGNPSIRRSHNSVNISFRQMLAYIDKVREPIPPGDINFLLKTYRMMAEMFYTQYERSLLTEIVEQRKTKQDADAAISYIDGLRDGKSAKTTLEAVNPQLIENRDAADIEYQKLIEKFPVLLQNALDKLRDEWQRVNTIATASQTLVEDEKLNRAIKAVVEVAAHSVGVEAERIAIVPGNAFALYFFTYLENFAVLTVPIYSVQNPWEWSIFWHELAGYKVRRLEKRTTIDNIKEKLIDFNNTYRTTVDKKKRAALISSITWSNKFCRSYIKGLFGDKLNLKDLGGIEYQFEQILNTLLSSSETEKFRAYDQLKAQGWSADWFKELFEDAWSVLAIGEPFLELLTDVLGRNIARDDRHPPLEVRLSVAKEILRLVAPQGEADDQQESENQLSQIEELAARQILQFISIIVAAARPFEGSGNASLMKLRMSQQKIRDKLFKKVRTEIQESTSNWLKYLDKKNPLQKVKDAAEKISNVFSDPDLEKLLSDLRRYEEINQIKQSFKVLLMDRDYQQLLKLSFTEIDFFNANKIRNIQFRLGLSTPQKFFAIDDTVNFIVPANCLVPGVGGDISFDLNDQAYHTSAVNWNKAFELHPEYQI